MTTMFWCGLALVVGGVFVLWNEHRVLAGSVIVQGTVIAHSETRSGRNNKAYFAPKVEYQTPEGRRAEFTAAAHTLDPDPIGTRVKVAYRSDEPGNARIVSFNRRFAAAWALLGAGLCLMLIAYGFLHGDDWLKRIYPLRPQP